MNVTLKDGSVLAVESGATFMEVAQSISEGLARNAVCAKWNGKLVDLSETVNGDGALEIKDAMSALPEFKRAFKKNLEIL